MSSYNEIKNAIKKLKGKKIYLLHCVSLYPCPPNFVNLKRIKSLGNKFNLPIGYSDHSIGINACFGAIIMGSKVIEKHFTLNKKWKGADHELSADQKDLSMICDFAKNYSKLVGTGSIEPSTKEIKMRKFFRKSLFAKKSMKIGEKISLDKIEARRPGLYMKSDNISKIIGKRIKKNIFKDTPIRKSDIK